MDPGAAVIVFGFAAIVVLFLVGIIVTDPLIGLLLTAIVVLVVWSVRSYFRRDRERLDRRARPHLYPDEMAKIEAAKRRSAEAWAAIKQVVLLPEVRGWPGSG